MNAPFLLLTDRPTGLVGHEQGFLRVQGRDFVTDDDKPWQFRGYTVHYGINAQYGTGAASICDFEGMLDDAVELGANTIITLGMHASPWKTANGWRCTPIEHPDYFRQLERMFRRIDDRKLRCAHGPLVDMQHLPASFDKQAYWRDSCSVMDGRALLLARKGNEMDHNGWHQSEYHFPDMHGVLCSNGSIGEDMPPRLPYRDWCELETRRDLPKGIYDSTLRQVMDGDFIQDDPGMPWDGMRGPATERPTVSIEPIFFNDVNPDHVGDERSTDERVALEIGLLTGCCAGGAFGASYSLECRRLLPHARHIAVAYFRGLSAGFVRPLAALDFQGSH